MKNVHIYDGELRGIFKKTRTYSKEEKITLFDNLMEKLTETPSKYMLNIIKNDIDTAYNYDTTNQLDASDILAEIILTRQYDIYILEEQLKDMYTLGQCPSGRTTRLFQIWKLVE